VMCSSMESSTQSLDFSLTVVNSIVRRGRERKLHIIVIKQSLSDYA
jgi:hypothetical protein